MKKKRKFIIFPTLKLKNIVLPIAITILFISAFSAVKFFISENFNSEFIGFIIQTTIKQPYKIPEINIAKTVLSVSVPGIIFSEPATEEIEKPFPAKEPSHEISEPPTEVLENNAESITIQSAEEKGYKSVDGIYINNQTGKKIDISALLNRNLNLSLTDKPTVLIVHTHTTESYTPSATYNYTPEETDRTTDLNYNMASVGEVIYQSLSQNGINVIHDKSINDYPSYSKSYSNSLKLVQSYINQYPSIQIVIDVHRDAMITKDGTKLRPMASLSPSCAQVMMVVGTNDSGLQHPSWQTNLSFAIKLQHKMNQLYPTLARPINLRRERFNQHMAPYAFILEVGTNGNTLDEAKEGAKLFSRALISLLKD